MEYALYLPVAAYQPPVSISDIEPKSQYSGEDRYSGEITSLSSVPIYDVIVLLSGTYQGEPVAFTTRTLFKASLPGQKNLFDFLLPFSGLEDESFSILQWSTSNAITYAAAAVDYIVVSGCCGSVTIDATIRNDTAQALWNVQAIPWSITQAFQFDVIRVTPYLAPGESIDVTWEMFGIYDIWPTVNVIAQGQFNP